VILNMIDPGLCHSDLAREGSWQLTTAKLLLARTTEAGSRTLVAGALAGPESHGKYMKDAKIIDGAVSNFVRCPEGTRTSQKVWEELKQDSGVDSAWCYSQSYKRARDEDSRTDTVFFLSFEK
jgi:hypothetical protein